MAIELAPVAMSYMGHTLEFPRKDNQYKKKESIPYDEFHSQVWVRGSKNDWKENIKYWFVYMLGGVLIGITAFCMDKLEETLVDNNRLFLQRLIDASPTTGVERILLPWAGYCAVAACLGALAGAMTVYFGPGANGSGLAEMIGYMNGVNYPDFIGIKTLLTKILGVVLAVSSRLCVGKEGPLGHIGAISGILPIYIPW